MSELSDLTTAEQVLRDIIIKEAGIDPNDKFAVRQIEKRVSFGRRYSSLAVHFKDLKRDV